MTDKSRVARLKIGSIKGTMLQVELTSLPGLFLAICGSGGLRKCRERESLAASLPRMAVRYALDNSTYAMV